MGLTIKDLTYIYPAGSPSGVAAVCDVSFAVECGDLLIVAGATGSGKSTLLRLLSGLLTPSRGSVEVDGVSAADRAARGRVAIVFQNPESQFFSETLEADVAFGPHNLGYAEAENIARMALVAVGLDPAVYARRSPFTLSGGEARRAAIAGALAIKAPYLLLDEPTAGLDHVGRDSVLAVLESERDRAGVVVVTHDPGEFLAMASHVLVLDGGNMAFYGTVTELLESPDVYKGAGLRLPDLIQVQLNASTHGACTSDIVFEAEAVAARLLVTREMRQ